MLVAVLVIVSGLWLSSRSSTSSEQQLVVVPAWRGVTLSPGSSLPSGSECRRAVPRSGWEPRPENNAMNHSTPSGLHLPNWPDYWNPVMNVDFVPRIDGDYTGTTDEIFMWGACKWGFDVDLVRAMAVAESDWRQSQLGDYVDDADLCVGGYSTPCPTSFGILQIRHTFRPGSYPYSELYTAFNVDYSLAVLRGCYEGWITYLGNGYGAGDLWGCVGWHYSGEWKDDHAAEYVERVKSALQAKPWRSW